MFLDLLPLVSSQPWQQDWAHYVCSVLATGKSTIFPIGKSFIIFETDGFSEKCVFIRMKIWLMARKILNIWPRRIIFPISWFHTAGDQGGLLKQEQGGNCCHIYRIKHKTKVICKCPQLLKCPNHTVECIVSLWEKAVWLPQLCLSQSIKYHLLTSTQRPVT